MKKKVVGILSVGVLLTGCSKNLSKEDYVKEVNTLTSDMISLYSDLPSAVFFSEGEEQLSYSKVLDKVISVNGPEEFKAQEKLMDDQLKEIVKLINDLNNTDDQAEKSVISYQLWDLGYEADELAKEYDNGLFKKQ